jgi:cell division protein FtsI (penicillin-binding protein 3)
VLVLLAVLAGRLVWLQGIGNTAYAADASTQRLRTNTVVAPRGEITDRSGEPFALSLDARAVYGEPRIIARADCKAGAEKPCRPDTIAAALAPVIGSSAKDLEEKLSRTSAFVYLARGLDPAVGKKVRELGLVGVGVLQEPKRTHPGGDLAVSVTGFTDREGRGLMGVESGMDSVLSGRNGKTTAEVDRAGRVIPTGATTEVAAVPGRDVQLTIDRDLQWYAQQVLARKVAETEAVNGTAVVMDIKTGEVLALATSPTFNPDDRSTRPSPQALKNVAIADVYEPGSVNKVITAAAALEEGLVTPETPITVPPTYQVGRHTVHDSHPHPTWNLTFAGVLARSSNIGTVMVGQRVGAEKLYEAMRRFGYGEKTGLGLPGESRGLLPKPADWSGTSIATIPIGQGVSTNVMQVASVYATIANAGVRVTPTVVKAVADTSGHHVPAERQPPRRVISPEVAKQISLMLEAVVTEEGTAPLAAVPGYRIAGKTGTAQRVVKGRYDGSYTSSFIGFAPADAPRLVTAVVLQGTGRRAYYGGSTAGPVFKDVMSFALRGLKIAPTGTVRPPIKLTAG